MKDLNQNILRALKVTVRNQKIQSGPHAQLEWIVHPKKIQGWQINTGKDALPLVEK